MDGDKSIQVQFRHRYMELPILRQSRQPIKYENRAHQLKNILKNCKSILWNKEYDRKGDTQGRFKNSL